MIPAALMAIVEAYLQAKTIQVAVSTVSGWIDSLQNAFRKGEIKKGQPGYEEAKALERQLVADYNNAVKTGKDSVKIAPPAKLQTTLCGLSGGFSGTRTGGAVLLGADITRMDFKELNLPKKYELLLGKITPRAAIMVFGKYGGGKSTFCVGFARDLAHMGFKVKYLALEEELSATLKNKILQLDATNPNIHYHIDVNAPFELQGYDFVIVDSIEKLQGYGIPTVKKMKEKYPNTVFVYVYQSTKTGAFRGTSKHPHEMDVVVKIAGGMAMTEKSRYVNKGYTGEMEISFTAPRNQKAK